MEIYLARNTVYCSQCGKGNIVVDAIAEVNQFICISCNAVNILKAQQEQGTRRLKDVYEQNQQTAGDRQNRMATLRRKKTLVDKNIDLLERVEAMERDALQMKNEYLEMTKELSKASTVAPPTETSGVAIEEVREMFIGLQEIVLDVQEQLVQSKENKESFAIDFDEVELRVASALSSNQKPAFEPDIFLQEFKTVQHVLNTIAGEVRSVKQELGELRSQINEIKNIDFSSISRSNDSAESESGSRGSYDAPSPMTTQILAADKDVGGEERKESSIAVKPLKGSNKLKAMSEKLKNLKL